MKYYTPELEEFFPGFEFEESFEEKWYKRICWRGDYPKLFDEDTDYETEYRVKYLDEQDIKELGFESVWLEGNVQTFNKGNIVISWWINSTHIRINYTSGWQLFDGQIKNKSELRKLMKQLGII